MSRAWGVEVSETAIYQGPAAEKWGVYRHMILEPTGAKITPMTRCIMGDTVFVERANRASAHFLADLIVGWGAPKLAVKVRRAALEQEGGR